MTARLAAVAYALVGVTAVVLLWTVFYLLEILPAYSLPSPWSVASTMASEFDLLLPELVVTGKAFLFGLAISLVSGVAVGIAIVDSRTLGSTLYPVIVTAQVVPKIAVGPVLLVWFGYGVLANSLIAALIAFFPVVLATIVGLGSVPAEKLYLARSTGAGWTRTLFRIRLPSALPTLMSGIRLATVYALTGAIIAEFIGADEGIGRRIVEASAAFATETVFAATAYAVLLGFAAFGIVAAIEARVTRWNRAQRRRLLA